MALFQSATKGKWDITLTTATECKTKKQNVRIFNHYYLQDRQKKYTDLDSSVCRSYCEIHMICMFEHQTQIQPWVYNISTSCWLSK